MKSIFLKIKQYKYVLFQCYYSGLDLKKNDYARVRKVGDSPGGEGGRESVREKRRNRKWSSGGNKPKTENMCRCLFHLVKTGN